MRFIWGRWRLNTKATRNLELSALKRTISNLNQSSIEKSRKLIRIPQSFNDAVIFHFVFFIVFRQLVSTEQVIGTNILTGSLFVTTRLVQAILGPCAKITIKIKRISKEGWRNTKNTKRRKAVQNSGKSVDNQLSRVSSLVSGTTLVFWLI